jgi:peptide deformylase
MATRRLHVLGSPVLRERAKDVSGIDEEVRTLVTDLFDTMYAAKGIGLAANQIGVARQIAVVEAEDDQAIVLINPVILERDGKERAEEGCLSIPEIFGDVDRAARIVVETTTTEGARERHEVTGITARAVQHELDHLNGVLFIDHLSPLKRRMLLKKWRKSRKGATGLTIEPSPPAPASP